MTSTVLDSTSPAALGDARRSGVALARVRAFVAQRVYVPALAVPAVALALVAVGWRSGWGGADFGGSVTLLRGIVAGPVTLAIIGVFLVVERRWPAQPRPIVARGHRHDLMFAVTNALLVVPLGTALTLGATHAVHEAVPWLVLPRMELVPRWIAVALIVVAMDGCNWAVHLANHRWLGLWRFHELHHSQEDLNVLTVFRTHPLIHVSYLGALLPGLVLLNNGAMSVTVLVVYGAMVAFAHSNTLLGFGWLERIFVSPNYHRIHHQLDGPQDVNLGFALTIWDQLFGRAVFPTERTVRADTGIPGRPLVDEYSGPRARHFAVFAAQMVAPFRPYRGSNHRPPLRTAPNSGGHDQ